MKWYHNIWFFISLAILLLGVSTSIGTYRLGYDKGYSNGYSDSPYEVVEVSCISMEKTDDGGILFSIISENRTFKMVKFYNLRR